MRILHPILGKISHQELSELPIKLFTLRVVHHSPGPPAHVWISLRRTTHIQGHPSRSSEKFLVQGFEVQNHVNSPHIEWSSTQVTPFMSLACITLASPLAPTMSFHDSHKDPTACHYGWPWVQRFQQRLTSPLSRCLSHGHDRVDAKILSVFS